MWPTMLATASSDSLAWRAADGTDGTAGTLSIRFVLPLMGAIYDNKKIEIAGGEAAFNALPQGSGSNACSASRPRPHSAPSPFCRLFCYSFSVRSGFTTDQKKGN